MKLQLFKLQNNDKKAKMLRSTAAGLPEGWEDNKKVF